MSITERLKSRPQATSTFTLAWDPDDARELERLTKALTAAEKASSSDPKATAARKAVTAAKKALTAHKGQMVTITFTFTAIGAAAIELLRSQCPPTDEQIEASRANAVALGQDPDEIALEFSIDTYLPRLLAASVTRVEMSDTDEVLDSLDDDTARSMCESFGQGDRVQILNEIEMLSMRTARVGDLGKG